MFIITVHDSPILNMKILVHHNILFYVLAQQIVTHISFSLDRHQGHLDQTMQISVSSVCDFTAGERSLPLRIHASLPQFPLSLVPVLEKIDGTHSYTDSTWWLLTSLIRSASTLRCQGFAKSSPCSVWLALLVHF